jgi:hypothetical protein
MFVSEFKFYVQKTGTENLIPARNLKVVLKDIIGSSLNLGLIG